MTDIVERLRAMAQGEAAAEIERLRAERDDYRLKGTAHIRMLAVNNDNLHAEIGQLREQHELALQVHDKMADEIVRLRAAWDASIAERNELLAEIERLRAAGKRP